MCCVSVPCMVIGGLWVYSQLWHSKPTPSDTWLCSCWDVTEHSPLKYFNEDCVQPAFNKSSLDSPLHLWFERCNYLRCWLVWECVHLEWYGIKLLPWYWCYVCLYSALILCLHPSLTCCWYYWYGLRCLHLNNKYTEHLTSTSCLFSDMNHQYLLIVVPYTLC